jgi:hypothetical protein
MEADVGVFHIATLDGHGVPLHREEKIALSERIPMIVHHELTASTEDEMKGVVTATPRRALCIGPLPHEAGAGQITGRFKIKFTDI